MIVQLPKRKKRTPRNLKQWHIVWCLWPRVIDNRLVWLSRIERRLHCVKQLYDGSGDIPYMQKHWKYKLIDNQPKSPGFYTPMDVAPSEHSRGS